MKKAIAILFLSSCSLYFDRDPAPPDARARPVDARAADADAADAGGADAAEPDAQLCWSYRQSHCVTTGGGYEQVCIPYDGCGCYRCAGEEDGGQYCYCGPGGL